MLRFKKQSKKINVKHLREANINVTIKILSFFNFENNTRKEETSKIIVQHKKII